MSRLVKTMTLPIRPNTSSARLADEVAEMEAINKQLVPGEMRQWLLAGFELSQLKHGIMESWLAMANGGQLKNMTSREKSEVLKNIIDRTLWLDEEVKQKTPEKSGVTAKPDIVVVSKPVNKTDTVTSPKTGTAGIPEGFDLAEEF